MKDIDWYILSTLYASRNITKTAELLFMAQPTLTKHLQQIERELGIVVVKRNNKGVQFTPQGDYLAQRAKEMVVFLEETKCHLEEMNAVKKETLTVGVPNSYARFQLPGVLKSYNPSQKQLNIKIDILFSDKISKLVADREIDVGIMCGECSFKANKVLIFMEQLYIVSKNKVLLDELSTQPQISFTRSKSTQIVIDNWWNKNFTRPQSIALNVNHADTCIEMVSQGLGYGFLFGENFLNKDKDIFGIPVINNDGTPVARNVWIIYNDEAYEKQHIKGFVDFMKDIYHVE